MSASVINLAVGLYKWRDAYIASKPVFKLALSRTHAPVLQYAEYCDKSSNQFHWLHDYWGNALSIATLPNAFCRSMNVTNVEVFKAWLMPSNLFLRTEL